MCIGLRSFRAGDVSEITIDSTLLEYREALRGDKMPIQHGVCEA